MSDNDCPCCAIGPEWGMEGLAPCCDNGVLAEAYELGFLDPPGPMGDPARWLR